MRGLLLVVRRVVAALLFVFCFCWIYLILCWGDQLKCATTTYMITIQKVTVVEEVIERDIGRLQKYL